ncbi:tetratricopeptide repeat protein [Sutcliffiella rhizosphaerae]|uniref:Beta-barrel assembly-enhancing protease n=1 Tax=Sutcliffiella rhizosphaerae TaxID=2880967 RepID=A0ABN8AHT0_9BACI|nr:tetratricopeptide repeat protein [Sutcliffiella rhizosphaerae]CAG9622643.1 Beta-barrel assembly-enhancing protease [Sutcliffiella rhizosphaerae]
MSYTVIDQALELIDNGEMEKGLALLKENENSLGEEDLFQTAQIYQQLGMLEDAKIIFRNLLYQFPNESDLIISLAEVHIDLDEEDEAMALLDNISQEDNGFVQALLLLADLYQAQGLFEVSEQKLLTAKKLAPNEPIITLALGELNLSKGDYKKAIPYYEAIGNDNNELDYPLDERLAECYSATGQFEEAMPFYDKALQNQLKIDVLFQYGFTAFQAGYFKTCIEKLNQVKELDHEYSSIYLYLAKAYEQEGMLKESLETAKEGLAVNEFNKELQLYGARVAIKQQNSEEAEKLLREAIAVDPGYVEAAMTLTKIFLQDERYEDVIDTIQELIRFGETDPQYDWDLAVANQNLEKYSDALNHYRLAYTSFKDDSSFLYDYAHFLLEEGLREEAKPLFEKLIQLDPTNIELQDLYLSLQE